MKYIYSYNVHKNGFFYKTVYSEQEAKQLVLKLESQHNFAWFSYCIEEKKHNWTKIQLG
jgi:hypothetical protein